MNKDLTVDTILKDLNLKPQPSLTPEQEETLKRELNPEEQYLYNVEKLFNK